MTTNGEFGAFVDLDVTKLDRTGLVMLGMKESLDRWIEKLNYIAEGQPIPAVGQVMREIAAQMTKDRDGIAVELTKQSFKTKAGQVHKLRKDGQ